MAQAKHQLILAALFCGAVQAAPLAPEKIAGMASQIDTVMNAKLCAVANDTKDYGGETVLVVLPKPVGARRILKNDYHWMRNTGYDKTKAGEWLMTYRMRAACKADGEGGRCIAFRSYFSQFPVSARAPGDGVVTK